MTHTPKDLDNWPLNLIGWPIFTDTKDALLYGNLIHDNPVRQASLVRYRKETYAELKCEREKKAPDLQHMMDLAITAQLYRESYTEAARINHEKFNSNGWNPTR